MRSFAAAGALVEQVVGVLLLDELRQDDDADGGMLGADLLGGADALVGPARRHPDVCEDRVRLQCADGGEQLVEVGGGADHLDLGRLGQERHCSLANQIVILREHDAQHGRMVHGRQIAA
jgi:hypothetical protein